jgi:hypothetical protein
MFFSYDEQCMREVTAMSDFKFTISCYMSILCYVVSKYPGQLSVCKLSDKVVIMI